MAWLQNLAGRAENLLNKIDQNAANVLNDPNLSKKYLNTQMENEFIPPEEGHHYVKFESENNLLEIKSFNEDPAILSDTISVISESSRLSDSNGISFHTKQDNFVVESDENLFDQELSDPSTVFSKCESLQNSFILPDETHTDYEERIVKLEEENQKINKQLLNLQHLYSEVQNENLNLQNQLERANESVIQSQKEMEQYRARAQRILQEKEKLIALKTESKQENKNEIIISYNDELKKELQFQEEKNSELTGKLDGVTNELMGLQNQLLFLQKNNQTSNQNIQEALIKERKIRSTVEEECQLKTKELQTALQELSLQYSLLKVKNQELLDVKEKLKQKANFKITDDAGSQVRTLTHTLLAKQNNLETVTTERNALRLQLEKLETEHYKVLTQIQGTQVKIISVNDTDDAKSQVPRFMKISPFDAGVTRRVKHAYSSLDAISIRTGIFLRRYPVARVFVFCYMVLVHLWVLFILLAYIPNTR